MSDWMAAADAMIHATAGLTVLEAHIRGCPVVSYGFSAGHLRANNAAFERFGLAEVARSDHELESVLRHVTRERRSPDSSFASLPSIASRALTVRPRVRPQPVWRLRTERVAAAVAVAAVAVVLVLSLVQRESPLKRVAEAGHQPHPHRQGQRHHGQSRQAAAARRPSRPPQAKPRPAALLDRGAAAGAAARRGRRRPRRPGAGAGGAGARRARSGSCCARRGRRASPSPSTTARTRRGRRRCWRRCARPARRRPSSSPASRSCGGRRWSAEIVAAGHRVELHCHRHRNQLRLGAAAAARGRRAGQGGDRGGGRPGGRRLPPALRDLQRRRPAGGARPRLAAGAVVAVGEGLGRAGRRRPRSRVDATAGVRAGDILLLHDADYYSARGSWVRTAAALPMILEELEARGLKSRLLRR